MNSAIPTATGTVRTMARRGDHRRVEQVDDTEPKPFPVTVHARDNRKLTYCRGSTATPSPAGTGRSADQDDGEEAAPAARGREDAVTHMVPLMNPTQPRASRRGRGRYP
jgi:hypothetical protein